MAKADGSVEAGVVPLIGPLPVDLVVVVVVVVVDLVRDETAEVS
jgi:hypothetical protein